MGSIVEPGTTVHTDGWNGYAKLTLLGFDHRPIKQRCRHADRQIVLPRAHRVASNLNYSAGNGQPVE